MIFASSNHLVSVGIAVVKLNLTIFAPMTTYLHPFQEKKTPKTQKPKMPKTPEEPNIEKGKHFVFYKRNPSCDFCQFQIIWFP